MNILTNREIRQFFVLLLCVLAALVVLPQLYFWLSDGGFRITFLLLTLLPAAGAFAGFFVYFYRQQKAIEHAVSQIERFVSGDHDARIESEREGDLYKLFHAVNTLATALGAHAAREQTARAFLKNTIADISHQLKTPLAALTIYNALLQEECADGEAVRAFAVKSEREIERIETLVDSLLKITKFDAGSIVMDRRTENVPEMMEDVRSRFETRAEMEQKTLVLSGAPDISLLCDRVWLAEAVSNLVKNALDHTEAGGKILISWDKLPAVTQIIVKDDGSGIHPEDIHHVFKRFYRSRFSKDVRGVGLGLPLTKAIAAAHDGTIAVDSAPGQGSAFVMSFLNPNS